MPRAIVFIDFENYEIGKNKYYKTKYFSELQNGEDRDLETEAKPMYPKLDYVLIAKELTKLLPNNYELIKTFVFAPKPDEFLMNDKRREGLYNWVSGMNGYQFLTVVEGQHIARPVIGYTFETMSIDNPSSYYVVEKGTDVALSAQLLSSGFFNSCDAMIVVSADQDYIPVYDVLRSMGKIVVVVSAEGQNLYRLRPHTDAQYSIGDSFFQKCIRTYSKTKPTESKQ